MLKGINDFEILHKMTTAVHESLDLNHIYNIALDLVLTLKDVDMAFIYLITKDRKEAVLVAQKNLTKEYIGKASRIPYPKGVTWKLLNTGKVFNIENIQRDNDVGPAGREMGHQRALGIPIILEGVVLGVIWLASYKSGKFSEQEIKLNTSIGNNIGIAIAKAKLYEEMEEQIKLRTSELEETNRLLHQEIEDHKRTEYEIKTIRKQHELLNSMENIIKKVDYIDLSTAEKLVLDVKQEINTNSPNHQSLSDREYKVMLEIASGKSTKQISNELFLSKSTISTYRARILEKLNLKTNADIIRYAINNNLIK